MATKSNVYIINSARGGISDDEDKGIKGAFKFASNLDIRKEKDSISAGQALVDEGLLDSRSASSSVSPSLSPSYSPSLSPSPSISPTPSPSSSISASPSTTASVSTSLSPSATPSSSTSLSVSPSSGLSTRFEGLIRFFVKCSDGYTYGFDNVGHVYRRDSDALWQWVYKDENGAIKGACEKPSSGGKTYLYWATNTILKRKPIPGKANWNDVETVAQNLSSQDWHTMNQVGGSLMIANGSFLAMVGYDDSYTNEALDLIPGNVAKTLVERSGRVIIGTYKKSDPLKGINAAIDAEVPLAQIGDEGQLFYANMADKIPYKKFPGGGQVNPGGVTNEIEQPNFFEWEQDSLSWIDKQEIGNMSLWGVYNADSGKNGVYSIGRKYKNHPFVMNLEYALEVSEIGAIVNVDGTTLISYRNGSSFGVKAVDSTAKAVGTYEGLDLKAPTKQPINITEWKTAKIFTDSLPTGTSIEFYYRVNKKGDFVRANTLAGGSSYNTVGGQEAVFTISAKGEIFEPKLILYPSGNTTPEVYKIEIYFD